MKKTRRFAKPSVRIMKQDNPAIFGTAYSLIIIANDSVGRSRAAKPSLESGEGLLCTVEINEFFLHRKRMVVGIDNHWWGKVVINTGYKVSLHSADITASYFKY
jgi:hypothetical protein